LGPGFHFPPCDKKRRRALGLGKFGPYLDADPCLLEKFGHAAPVLVSWIEWYFENKVQPANANPVRARMISDALGAFVGTVYER
jgi:hypothetical protein